LKDAGVPGVVKTRATNDQGADLVINIGKRVIVVQAKQCQAPQGNTPVQEILGAMSIYHANEAWVVTTATFTKGAIDLARSSGVGLIDGSQLLNFAERLLRGVDHPVLALGAHYPEKSASIPATTFPLKRSSQKWEPATDTPTNPEKSVSAPEAFKRFYATTIYPRIPAMKVLVGKYWRRVSVCVAVVVVVGVCVRSVRRMDYLSNRQAQMAAPNNVKNARQKSVKPARVGTVKARNAEPGAPSAAAVSATTPKKAPARQESASGEDEQEEP
jgi:hypothetical protein